MNSHLGIEIELMAYPPSFFFFLERFFSIVLTTSEDYKLSYVPKGLQRRIKHIAYTPKLVHTKAILQAHYRPQNLKS